MVLQLRAHNPFAFLFEKDSSQLFNRVYAPAIRFFVEWIMLQNKNGNL